MESPDCAGDGCRPEPRPADSCPDSSVDHAPAQTRAPQERAPRLGLGHWWPFVLALGVLIAIAVSAGWGGSSATAWGAPAILPTGVPSRQFLPMIRKEPTPLVTPSPTLVPLPSPAPAPAGLRPSDFSLVWVNSAEEPHGDQRIQRGADTGARLDRFPVYWNLIEPSPGNFTWDNQDRALAANESHGLGTLPILLGVPGSYYPADVQASSVDPLPPIGGSIYRSLGRVSPLSPQGTCNGGGPPPPAGLYNPIFADNTDLPGTSAAVKPINPGNPWARFVDQIVNRYRPGGVKGLHVSTWEVWNEPDLCQFWRGTAPQYARLLKVAYLVIKQRDPQATVVMGGLAHFEQPGFLGELLDTLKADPLSGRYNGFFDAAGGHHYAIVWNGYSWTNDMRNALSARGWGAKPIWITESGVPVCNDYPGPPCPSPWRATPIEQAAYIWQNAAYTRMAGAGPIFQFNLFDDCGNVVAPDSPDGFGLIKNESTSYCSNQGNGAPRLSYTAFTLANRYLAGTELLWFDVQPGTVPRGRRFAFYDPASGERRTMVFAVDAATTVTLPATGTQARRVALDGGETLLTPTNGQYQIPLAGPTSQNWPNGSGYNAGIYGVPYLIIERDTHPPATIIAGLPATSPVSFPVSWTAGDLGSGLARNALYSQKDDGPWLLWWSGLPQGNRLSAAGTQQFNGEPGHRYRFAVMALDRAGNIPGAPVAQAETRTSGEPAAQVAVGGQVVNLRNLPAAGVGVAIGGAGATTDAAGQFSLSAPSGQWDVLAGGQVVIHGQQFTSATALALLLRPSANAAANGDFEAGLNGWQQSGSSPRAIELQPGTQDHVLHLATSFVPDPTVGGEEGSFGGNSTVSQVVHVPAGSPFLAFRYKVDSQETTTGHDHFEVLVVRSNNQADSLYLQPNTSQSPASDWRYLSRSLANYAGSDVTLIFNLYESSPYRRTSAWIDLVTIGPG